MTYNEIDLNRVVASQEKTLRKLLGDGVSLEAVCSAKAASIHADEGMIGQILTGLVDNARLSLPGGGNVGVITEHVEVDDVHSRLYPGARRGNFVRLTVNDNGQGGDTQTLKKLMLEIPSAPGANKTKGLPIPVIAGIVKRRHGWIEATSQCGGGTTIHVYFPVACPGSSAMENSPWVSETILLVDDEEAVRRMVRNVLHRASYDVIEADTGVHALSVWEEHKDRVNLLLTDMVMPDGLTGRDVAKRLRALKPGLKVIYTSGFDLDAEAKSDTEVGAVGFLHKPYDMRCLLETVHRTMSPSPESSSQCKNPNLETAGVVA